MSQYQPIISPSSFSRDVSSVLKYFLWVVLLLNFCFASSCYAILNLQLTKGLNAAIPIAVVPFANSPVSKQLGSDNIAAIIQNDLHYSGRFNLLPQNEIAQQPHQVAKVNLAYWRSKKLDDIVIGYVVKLSKDRYEVHFALIDVYQNNRNVNKPTASQILVQRRFIVPKNKLRYVAHKISDTIFAELTGIPGVFATKIAYIEIHQHNGKRRHTLMVADADGFNPELILGSNQPIMSPAWSPNGKQLAYVSFENGRAQVYISNVQTGRRHLVSSYPGINGAPAWSPNGRKLALVLSKSGSPKIYVMNLANKKLTQLTFGASIDTEPSFSPDGRSLLFTSDRGGSPQIYQINLASKQVSRITYNGDYNASASYTDNGKQIVFLHRDEQGYNIAMLNMITGQQTVLTHHGRDESPSLAPNGKMVVYASSENGHGVLEVVSTNTQVSYRLPATDGNVQEPAWSPFLG